MFGMNPADAFMNAGGEMIDLPKTAPVMPTYVMPGERFAVVST